MRVFKMVRTSMMAVALVMSGAVVAQAGTIFTEQFQFPDVPGFPPNIPAGQNYYIGTEVGVDFCELVTFTCKGAFADVLFDLTSAGNLSEYRGETLDVFGGLVPIGSLGTFSTSTPTTDATGYVAGTAFLSGSVTLRLRGGDAENDNVIVGAFAADGGGIVLQQTLIGAQAATDVVIPLTAAQLAFLAADGKFGITLKSFGIDFGTHDYNVERATLVVEQVEAVPEPSTITLLGAGLAIAYARRRALARR